VKDNLCYIEGRRFLCGGFSYFTPLAKDCSFFEGSDADSSRCKWKIPRSQTLTQSQRCDCEEAKRDKLAMNALETI